MRKKRVRAWRKWRLELKSFNEMHVAAASSGSAHPKASLLCLFLSMEMYYRGLPFYALQSLFSVCASVDVYEPPDAR